MKASKEYIAAWNQCNLFGFVCTVANRTNEVPNYLTKLGVAYLIPYLFIDHQTQAFVYTAYLRKKHPIHVVEIYNDLHPRSIEWRMPDAQFGLKLEDELKHGFDENVIITEFTVPFGKTAWKEVMLN